MKTLTGSKIECAANEYSMINAYIVEDEPKGLLNLKQMLAAHCPDVTVIGEAGGVKDGYTLFTRPEQRPDVAFLDINLSDGKVFQLLNQLRPIDFEIIFVTAWSEFAINACEYGCIGYILKPIDSDQLVDAVNRVRIPSRHKEQDQRYELVEKAFHAPEQPLSRITIPTQEKIHFIDIEDIIRLEADDSYTYIYLKNKERILSSRTLKVYENLLREQYFFRVHNSHYINLKELLNFDKQDGYVEMSDHTHIEVARRRRKDFVDYLRKLKMM